MRQPPPRPPLVASCDTIVAQARAVAAGVTLFGKNSDRPPNEAQALSLLEKATHPPGARLRCQYVEIPQVRETARLLGSGPTWLWGLEMGLNEHGVAIGNETIFAHEAPAATGLLGMDLVRLGLERGRAAGETVQIMIELIETHGQGGSGYRDVDWPYNNSFLIADPGEAWILEAAGRQWAARRCAEVDAISNQVSIGADWDRLAAGAVARAREAGLAAAEPFDFALAYRDTDSVPRALSEGRLRRSRALLRCGSGKHTIATLRDILADHDASGARFAAGATPDQEQFYTLCMHQGPSRTAASMIAALEPAQPRARTAWFAFGRPCVSVYFPLVVAGTLPDALARAGDEGPPGSEGLWWVFERLVAYSEASSACADMVVAKLGALEQAIAADFADVAGALASLPADDLAPRAGQHAAQVATQLDAVARELAAACQRMCPLAGS